MGRAFRTFDQQVLQNPWLSRIGNAGLLAAGLGATLDVALGLPVGWTVAIAISAFLAGLSPLRRFVNRLSSWRVTRTSDIALATEAAHEANAIFALLADAKRDEPPAWNPESAEPEYQDWAAHQNEVRRVDNRVMARYLERHQGPVFVLSNEMSAREALTDDEVMTLMFSQVTKEWLDRVGGLLLLGARRLRERHGGMTASDR